MAKDSGISIETYEDKNRMITTVTASVPTGPWHLAYWPNALQNEIIPRMAEKVADALYERVMAEMDLDRLVKEAATQVGAKIAEKVFGGAK